MLDAASVLPASAPAYLPTRSYPFPTHPPHVAHREDRDEESQRGADRDFRHSFLAAMRSCIARQALPNQPYRQLHDSRTGFAFGFNSPRRTAATFAFALAAQPIYRFPPATARNGSAWCAASTMASKSVRRYLRNDPR